MLADLAQVAALLGRALTGAETTRAGVLGPSVDALIEAHCGRFFTPRDVSSMLQEADDGTVSLWPPDVIGVTEVLDDAGDLVTFAGPVRAEITVEGSPGWVTVEWEAGFSFIPDEVEWAASHVMAAELARQAVAAEVAALDGVKSERVGETTIEWSEREVSAPMVLPGAAVELLRKWRLRGRPATTKLETSVPAW